MPDVHSVVYATDELGDPLAEMPYLERAPQATNLVTYSNDLTDASWTATTVTVAQDAEGIDGAPTSACTLTATAANGTVICNAVTAASGNHATAWHIKRKTGTGTVELTTDGGTTWQDITSQVSADFARIAVDQAAAANPAIGIRLVTDTDAVYVGNAECYAGTTKEVAATLPPIFTAGSSLTRDSDAYSFDSANWNDQQGTVYLEAHINDDCNVLGAFLDVTSGFVGLSDGTSSVRAASFVVGDCQIGFRYSASEQMRLCVDGAWSETIPYDGNMLSGALDLFRSAASVGEARDLRIWGDASESVIDALMPAPTDYGTNFVMVAKTTAASESFTVPCKNVGTFNCTIDWGDGSADSTITAYNDADLAHTYDDAGLHVVTISGDFPNIYFNNGGDKLKIVGVLSHGVLTSLERAFYQCINIVFVGGGDVSAVSNFYAAWYSNEITSFPVLDFSSGTNFYACWQGCPLVNFPAGMFDSCPATNYRSAFIGCALSQTSVDNILVSIDTAGQSGGTLDIWSGTSSPPSAIGLAAKTSLEGKGWTVKVNT